MNDDSSFYIDAAVPGNSGVPVFIRPSLMYREKEAQTMGGGHFIRIIGEYLPYDDLTISIQTGLRVSYSKKIQLFLKYGHLPS
jgi:hypothetical protein